MLALRGCSETVEVVGIEGADDGAEGRRRDVVALIDDDGAESVGKRGLVGDAREALQESDRNLFADTETISKENIPAWIANLNMIADQLGPVDEWKFLNWLRKTEFEG